MAKKTKKTVKEQIATLEQFILTDIFPRFKKNNAGCQAELDTAIDLLHKLFVER